MRRVSRLILAGALVISAAIAARFWLGWPSHEDLKPPMPAGIDQIDRGIAGRVQQAAQLIEAQPKDSERWRTLGLVYQANGVIDLAIQCHQQAVALDSSNVKSWYMLGLAQYKQGDADNAINAMHRVLELERTYSPAWWRLGFMNIDRGNLDDAQYAFEIALTLEPGNLASLIGMARVSLQNGQYAAAAKSLSAIAQQMPSQHPTYGYVSFLLSTAYRRMGQHELADRALVQSRSNPTEPVWNDPWEAEQSQYFADIYARMNHAEWLASEDRFDEAIAMARELLKERPESISMLLLIGACLRHQQKYDESLVMIAKAESLSPDWVNVHVNYARTRLAQSEHAPAAAVAEALRQKALEHIKRALAINQTLPMAHGVHGDILMAMRQFDQAAASYSTAAQNDRQPIPWLMREADARGRNQKWNDAAQALEQVTALAPDYADAWFQLGMAQAQAGASAKAQQSFIQAQQLRPNDSRIRAALMNLHSPGPMGPTIAEPRR